MRHRLLVIFFLLNSHVAAQQTQPDKRLYQPTGNEAVLTGTISVNGPIPKPLRIDMTADPVCVDLNPQPETEWLITNDNKLVNAFVYIKNGDPLQAYRFELPVSEVVLQRKNCQYSPRVLGLRVGQRLVIPNNDPTQHNTHPTPKLNQEWNQTQPPQSSPLIKTFTRPEVLIPFKCNQHPWEKAYVSVLDHPFFAVTDEIGNFEIRGLPAGAYTLVVWHEKLGEQEREITVVDGESRRIDFTFKTEKKSIASFSDSRRGSARAKVPAPVAGSSPDK